MRTGKAESPWAVTLIFYAGIMMVMGGVFEAIQGLAALFDDSFFATPPRYAFTMDLTVWGWVHFIPYYPIWSILIIALDLLVIWAIAFHGRELAE